MGLLQKYRDFKETRHQKALVRNLKILKNPKSIKEDRAGAIDFFVTLDKFDEAIPALLQRFNYSLEHGINDQREKELVMGGILRAKEKALPYIQQYLTVSTTIAWPIKALQELATTEQIVEILETCLDYGDISFDRNKVDKNYDILCYLMEYKLPDGGKKVLQFVKDHDERVRFAAVEAVLEQGKEDVIRELEPFLLDDSAENTRIRRAVAEAYLKNRWVIHYRERIAGGPLLPGLRVSKDFRLEAG